MSALTLAAVAAAVVLAHSGEDGDARDEVPDASEACPRLRLDGADNATAARCGRFLLRDGEVHFRPNYRAETGAEGAAERAAQQRQRDQLVQLRDDMGRLTDAQSRTLAHLNQLLRRETRAAAGASCGLFYHPRWHYWVLGAPWSSWAAGGAEPPAAHDRVLLMTSSPANTPEEVGSYTRPDGSLVDPWVRPLDHARDVALHGGEARKAPRVRFVCESAPSTTVAPLHALGQRASATNTRGSTGQARALRMPALAASRGGGEASYETPASIPTAVWNVLTVHLTVVGVMTALALARGMILKGRRQVTVMTSDGGDATTWNDRTKSWVWRSHKAQRLHWWQRLMAGQVAGSDGGFRRARREEERVQYELVVGDSGNVGSRGTMERRPQGDEREGYAYGSDSDASDGGGAVYAYSDSDSGGGDDNLSCCDDDDDDNFEVPDV